MAFPHITFSLRKFISLLIVNGLLWAAISATNLHKTSIILFIILIIIVGAWYGRLFFNKKHNSMWRWFWGASTYFSLFIVISSVIYYIYNAQATTLVLGLFLAGLPALFNKKIQNQEAHILSEIQYAQKIVFEEVRTTLKFEHSSCLGSLFVWVPIIIDIYLISKLFDYATVETLLSPWQVVPDRFFVLFGISTLLLFVYTLKKLSNLRIFATMLHFFLFFSCAAIIYKIGFGFDGFVHTAAMETIFENGLISPKTPYYIGQYTLVNLLAHVTGASIQFINTSLLPLMISITAPLSLIWFIVKRNLSKTIRPVLFALLIPAGIFVSTTPQAVSLLLLLMLIFLTRGENSKASRTIGSLLSLASFVIHPLSGIPALIYMLFVLTNTNERTPKLIFGFYTFVGALALPIATFFQTNSLPNISALPEKIKTVFIFLTTLHPPDASLIMQFIYSYKHFCLPIIFILFVGLDIFYFKKIFHKRQSWPLLLTALITLINSALLSVFDYPFVIGYEQGAFSQRLLFITGLFLLPFFIAGLSHVLEQKSLGKNRGQNKLFKYSFVILFVCAITTAFYLSYPRVDRIERSKGYSTSIYDVETVAEIKELAGDKTYLVLSNQAVSAAAILVQRFQPTIQMKGIEQFVYPVPTGGPLYPYYLEMVYDKTFTKTTSQLKKITNVDKIYFVLNHYWTDAKKIIPIADVAAKQTIHLKKNWIFEF